MKIYINELNENWIVDRFISEWKLYNPKTFVSDPSDCDIIWVIAPWNWKSIPKKILVSKKVVCTIHHLDRSKKEEIKNFYKLDRYVDYYHSISRQTSLNLKSMSEKKIFTFPFWINQNIYFSIKNKKQLRRKYVIKEDAFVVGSFQRDSEGKKLSSPKLSKGPDRLLEIYIHLNSIKKNFLVLLTGYRRNYLISNLEKFNIKYKYFENVEVSQLNEFYNLIDLYIVASRVEGGPQAILECSIIKTPIISTDVGISREILHKNSIFDMNNFKNAESNIEYAFENVKNKTIPNGFESFLEMFHEVYEN